MHVAQVHVQKPSVGRGQKVVAASLQFHRPARLLYLDVTSGLELACIDEIVYRVEEHGQFVCLGQHVHLLLDFLHGQYFKLIVGERQREVGCIRNQYAAHGQEHTHGVDDARLVAGTGSGSFHVAQQFLYAFLLQTGKMLAYHRAQLQHFDQQIRQPGFLGILQLLEHRPGMVFVDFLTLGHLAKHDTV